MIQMAPIIQFIKSDITALKVVTLPSELQHLIVLKEEVGKLQRFKKEGEGFFLVQKGGQLIGFGSIEQSPDAPPTAGIALLNHCFIIPSERNKGYGNQLYRHLRQFAQVHFGVLQLNDACPLQQRMGVLIEL